MPTKEGARKKWVIVLGGDGGGGYSCVSRASRKFIRFEEHYFR